MWTQKRQPLKEGQQEKKKKQLSSKYSKLFPCTFHFLFINSNKAHSVSGTKCFLIFKGILISDVAFHIRIQQYFFP